MTDDLGDRMKAYESASTSRRAFKGQPIIVRLDGKSFHSFTRGLRRPYDEDLSRLMFETTRFLVDRFNPHIGYTQSDEITLVFYEDSDSKRQYPFDGRFQKLESVLAGACSAFFTSAVAAGSLPTKTPEIVVFDARAFVVPNKIEAYNCLLWRQQDATKNAVSMAAQSMFKHQELQNKSGPEMQEMMFTQHGVNFNDYPSHFKRGVFAQRRTALRSMTPEDSLRIPKLYWPENGMIERTEVVALDIWLQKQTNSLAVIFDGAEVEQHA